MFCKFCGKEIDENAKFCQHCGKSLNEEPNTKPKQVQNGIESNGFASGCGFIFLVFVVFFVVFSFGPQKPIQEDEDAQQSLARALCEQKVQENLKNPKSAEFAPRSNIIFKKIDNMKWQISSYVYATNGFGGTVKSDYSCTVWLDDENTGKIIDLNIK